jgi:hypothetical protein
MGRDREKGRRGRARGVSQREETGEKIQRWRDRGEKTGGRDRGGERERRDIGGEMN